MHPEDPPSIADQIISASYSIDETSKESIRQQLISLVNELINKDFHVLVQLLYRIDVDEKKIRLYLNQNSGTDSAALLADLIIERQLQKAESRTQFSEKKPPDDHEEKW